MTSKIQSGLLVIGSPDTTKAPAGAEALLYPHPAYAGQGVLSTFRPYRRRRGRQGSSQTGTSKTPGSLLRRRNARFWPWRSTVSPKPSPACSARRRARKPLSLDRLQSDDKPVDKVSDAEMREYLSSALENLSEILMGGQIAASRRSRYASPVSSSSRSPSQAPLPTGFAATCAFSTKQFAGKNLLAQQVPRGSFVMNSRGCSTS